MSTWFLIKQFLPRLRFVRSHLLLITVCLVAVPLLSTALLKLVAVLVDQVIVAGAMGALGLFLAGYAGLSLAKFLVEKVQERATLVASRKISMGLRADLYQHIMMLSPASLRGLSVGQVLSRMSGDTKHAEYLVCSGMVSALTDVVKIAIYTAFLYTLSSKLTLCALIMIPLLGITSLRGSARLRLAYDTVGREVGSLTSFAEERLSARPLVQAFGQEAFEASIYRRKCDSAISAEVEAFGLETRLESIFEAITVLGAVSLIAIGAGEVHAGAISIGALVAYLGSVGSLYEPAKSLANIWARFQRAAASAERFVSLKNIAEKVQEPVDPVAMPVIRGAIEFQNVTFGYREDAPTLKNISFKIEPGERVAIVGSSGAGKSTLLNLALRLHDVAEGAILIDGVDVRKMSLQTVRGAVGVVLQDSHIFRGSVAENIHYGNPTAPEARLYSVAAAAQAHDFISLMPDQYESEVGPRGSALSGGQRQRLAIARALMRETPVLILDEATASLDGETEDAIQVALNRFAGNRTVLTIAHRLASVRNADRVIVLDKGEIVESGRPEELLNSDTRCRKLFASQLSRAGT